MSGEKGAATPQSPLLKTLSQGSLTMKDSIDDYTPKPERVPVLFENIPVELKELPKWLVWKYEWSGKKWTKVPYQSLSTTRKASSTDQAAWSSMDEAKTAYEAGKVDGVGFAVTKDDPYLGVDLDDCLNAPWALSYIHQLNSYTETTPSQKGYRVWIKADKKSFGCKSKSFHNSKFEVYDSGRFFTVTGQGEPKLIRHRQEEFEIVAAPLNKGVSPLVSQAVGVCEKSDSELLSMLFRFCNGAENLYRNGCPDGEDCSGADLSLCNHLAFICGRDPEAMDRLFRQSALMRPKWDVVHSSDGLTYGKMTLFKAIADCKNAFGEKESVSPEVLGLDQFVLNGSSVEMRKQMLSDAYVLGKIALAGQWTVIFARPNAGKTLLTIWLLMEAIKSAAVEADSIYYVNADDNYKGLTEKLELAEEHGFNMLSPGHKGFKADLLFQLIDLMISQGQARGKIIILDTLKKFTDTMDKKQSSEFGKAARSFVSAGGTLICLSHVNKHADAEGKVIYAGTSDINDDADCTYTLQLSNEDSFTKVRTVKFENMKNRGVVASTATYEYDGSDDVNYLERLKSIQGVSDDEVKERVRIREREDRFSKDKGVVECIRSEIANGCDLKTELIKAVVAALGESRKEVRRVLDHYTGDKVGEYQYWAVQVGDKNSHRYVLNELSEIMSIMQGVETYPLPSGKLKNRQTG